MGHVTLEIIEKSYTFSKELHDLQIKFCGITDVNNNLW